jgi:hypothetical protein
MHAYGTQRVHLFSSSHNSLDVILLGTELENLVCANRKAVRGLGPSRLGGYRGVIGGDEGKLRLGPLGVLGLAFPTRLVTSQKVWVEGKNELDKIEGVWYEHDG